jgi:hypothetical protein
MASQIASLWIDRRLNVSLRLSKHPLGIWNYKCILYIVTCSFARGSQELIKSKSCTMYRVSGSIPDRKCFFTCNLRDNNVRSATHTLIYLYFSKKNPGQKWLCDEQHSCKQKEGFFKSQMWNMNNEDTLYAFQSNYASRHTYHAYKQLGPWVRVWAYLWNITQPPEPLPCQKPMSQGLSRKISRTYTKFQTKRHQNTRESARENIQGIRRRSAQGSSAECTPL